MILSLHFLHVCHAAFGIINDLIDWRSESVGKQLHYCAAAACWHCYSSCFYTFCTFTLTIDYCWHERCGGCLSACLFI